MKYGYFGSLVACPFKYKRELVDWLVTYKGYTKDEANKLNKRQCYKIWYQGYGITKIGYY